MIKLNAKTILTIIFVLGFLLVLDEPSVGKPVAFAAGLTFLVFALSLAVWPWWWPPVQLVCDERPHLRWVFAISALFVLAVVIHPHSFAEAVDMISRSINRFLGFGSG